jgi:hypothetical protein
MGCANASFIATTPRHLVRGRIDRKLSRAEDAAEAEPTKGGDGCGAVLDCARTPLQALWAFAGAGGKPITAYVQKKKV